MIEEVSNVIRYVARYIARSHAAKVFEPRVLGEFYRLNVLAEDEADRARLLRLFYAVILRQPTPFSGDRPLDQVVAAVRRRHAPETREAAYERITDQILQVLQPPERRRTAGRGAAARGAPP